MLREETIVIVLHTHFREYQSITTNHDRTIFCIFTKSGPYSHSQATSSHCLSDLKVEHIKLLLRCFQMAVDRKTQIEDDEQAPQDTSGILVVYRFYLFFLFRRRSVLMLFS